jgi:viroplasmin and RNaseH domain-containing protein
MASSLLFFSMLNAEAVVLYDEGRQFIDGVSLLRDKEDPKAYYYLPTVPAIAIDPVTQKPRMMLIKFVDPAGKTSGGLVHFLFTLDLPPDRIENINKQLEKKVPGASVRGPVILRAEGDEESDKTSFKIISSTLSTKSGQDSFTTSLVTSGVAPVTPGSQAAVAARLNEHGATLLWESLMQPTSDISVAISGSYEAALPAYRGKVNADLNTVYDHLFRIFNQQKGYTKTEIRKQFDELTRNGVIEVDVTDREGLGVDSSRMASLMNLVTEKLVDMLFDTTQGFSKLPEQADIPANVVEGRQKKGFLAELFTGSGDQEYVTDDQYTLREKQEIKRATFSMVFTQNTTIKVPFNSTGNMSGIYKTWGEDNELFRVVGLNDAAFEKREVFFEVDPAYYETFKESINSVTVSFAKKYASRPNQADFTSEIVFNHKDIEKASFSKSLIYPRLGLKGSEWHDYEYRTIWSFRDGKTVAIPKELKSFEKSNSPSISLAPPAQLTQLEIDGDAAAMAEANIRRAMVEFSYKLLGDKKSKSVALLPESKEILQSLSLLHDKQTPIRYRIKWYSKTGVKTEDWRDLDDTYMLLLPPEDKKTDDNE